MGNDVSSHVEHNLYGTLYCAKRLRCTHQRCVWGSQAENVCPYCAKVFNRTKMSMELVLAVKTTLTMQLLSYTHAGVAVGSMVIKGQQLANEE